jgi:pimeloyl-ACP methyl ester carboxylesterase
VISEASMTTLRRGYIDTSHGQMHYRTAGRGAAVLLMHQAGRTGAIYDRVADYLASEFQTIAIDLPGFGQSDPLPLPCAVSDVTEVVVEMLDGLGIDSVHLTGHHTGAVVAGDLAVRHPDRTRSFAPSGYPLYALPGEPPPAPGPAEPRPILTMGGHSVPVAPELHSDGAHLNRLFLRAMAMLYYSKVSLGETRMAMLPFEHLPAEDLDFINAFVVDGLQAISAAGTLSAVRTYDSESQLPNITVPTLFIESSGQIEAPVCQRAQALSALVPNSRTAVVDNGDIPVTYTRAEDLGAILKDFYRSVDAAVLEGSAQ